MIVLSLFDGMSCERVALERAGVVDVLAHIFKNIKIGDNNDKISHSE